MEIGLFYNPSKKITGCWKVVNNLLTGLAELGVKVRHNQPAGYVGVLQGTDAFFRKAVPDGVIGPEIVVLPTEAAWAFLKHQVWTQPSKWVVDYYKTFPECEKTRFHVWPVGIDTERFQPPVKKITHDCFVYWKNVTKQTGKDKLDLCIAELTRRKLSYKLITYGEYCEATKDDLARTCRFGIYLAGTESQGIAYMEFLSMGVPLYVVDCKTFLYKNFVYTSPEVSSAPYFDDWCGVKCEDYSRLDDFLKSADLYRPRNYILEHHTLRAGAQKYVDILKG